MGGIVSYPEMVQILLDCGPFNNDHELRAIFVDARVHAWKHVVPQSHNASERVKATIAELYDKKDAAGRKALVLLVEVLRDMTNEMSSCHPKLAALAKSLAKDEVDIPPLLRLQEIYLRRLFDKVSRLAMLQAIASKSAGLAEVYTALMTLGGKKPESAVAQLNGHKRLVLIGGPGSGKSTLVDFVVMCMAGELLGKKEANLQRLRTPLPPEVDEEDETPQPQPWQHGALLPIKIELRLFAVKGLPMTEQVTAEHAWQFWAAQQPADLAEYAPILKQQLQDKGGIWLFDGLDEIADPETRGPQVKQVIEDVARCYPQCRVVVTSRPYAYQNPQWQLHGFAQATLANWSEGQIRQFIQSWYGVVYRQDIQSRQARANELEQAILRERRELRSLAEKPLLLTLMVNLHATEGDLPTKRAELYEKTVQLLLEQWTRGAEEGATPLNDYLAVSEPDLRKLLQRLAFERQSDQPANVMATVYLDDDRLLSRLMRLAGKKVNPTELLEYLDQRAGILENVGAGIYRFPHRTFQEYLAACYLAEQGDFAAKTAELVRQDTNRWREVALLAGAKAASERAEAIWLLVDELCVEAMPEGARPETAEFMTALIAAQAILETANLSQPSRAHHRRLSRVRGWLIELARTALPPRERAMAGQMLAGLGDDRLGVA